MRDADSTQPGPDGGAVVVSGVIHAPLEEAWAWWTDFGDVGELFVIDHGLSRTRRRVTSHEGDTMTLEERGRGPMPGVLLVRHLIRVEPLAHEIDEEVVWPVHLRTRWRLEETAGETRVSRRVPRTGMTRLAPSRLVARWLQRDLDAHVAQANRELRPAP